MADYSIVDPSQVDPALALRLQLARAMMGATDFGPVASPWAALARAVQPVFGGMMAQSAAKQAQAQQAEALPIIAEMTKTGDISTALQSKNPLVQAFAMQHFPELQGQSGYLSLLNNFGGAPAAVPAATQGAPVMLPGGLAATGGPVTAAPLAPPAASGTAIPNTASPSPGAPAIPNALLQILRALPAGEGMPALLHYEEQQVGPKPALLTPDEVRAAGFPEGSVVQKSADGTYSVVSKAEKDDVLSPEAFQQKADLERIAHPGPVDSYQQLFASSAPPQGASAAAPGTQPPMPEGGSLASQTAFNNIWTQFTRPHEGGFNPSDANGQPVNMGINQGANPDVDVKNMTPQQAEQLAYQRYWGPSGAANLPPALQPIQFESAYVFGPQAAKEMLAASGGDPQKYLALRQQRFEQIVQNNPADAKYLPAWTKRNADLGKYAAGLSAQTSPQMAHTAGTTPTVPTGQRNEQFLSTLTPQNQAIVKAIVDGRFDVGRMGRPQALALATAAAQYDPTFDAANPSARLQNRVAFTKGPQGQSLTALNQGIGHAAQLFDAISGTAGHKFPLDIPGANLLNTLQNAAARSSGNPGITNYETIQNALATEAARIFQGGVPHEAEVQQNLALLSPNNSTAQKQAGLRTLMGLFKSRLDELGDQYNQGMGTTANPLHLLNPTAQAAFAKLSQAGVVPGVQTQSAAAPSRKTAPPPIGTIEQGHRYKGGDPSQQSSWEKV